MRDWVDAEGTVRRELLTARKGQASSVDPFDEACRTMTNWAGYKMMLIERIDLPPEDVQTEAQPQPQPMSPGQEPRRQSLCQSLLVHSFRDVIMMFYDMHTCIYLCIQTLTSLREHGTTVTTVCTCTGSSLARVGFPPHLKILLFGTFRHRTGIKYGCF